MTFREQMVCLWLAGDGGPRRQAWTAGILQDGKEHTLQGNPFLSCVRQVSMASPSQLFSSQKLPIPPVPKHSAQEWLCPSCHTVGHHVQSQSPIPQARPPQSQKTLLRSCKALASQAACTCVPFLSCLNPLSGSLKLSSRQIVHWDLHASTVQGQKVWFGLVDMGAGSRNSHVVAICSL